VPRASQFTLDDAAPVPYDVDPAAVLEGEPKQAIAILSQSSDGRTISGIFRSSRGKFRAEQAGDEWTLVRTGRVIVTADDGSSVDCRPGDVMTLENGGTYVFEVLEDLEDYFVITNAAGIQL
jgi:uncharacterized cupin superfamily protein